VEDYPSLLNVLELHKPTYYPSPDVQKVQVEKWLDYYVHIYQYTFGGRNTFRSLTTSKSDDPVYFYSKGDDYWTIDSNFWLSAGRLLVWGAPTNEHYPTVAFRIIKTQNGKILLASEKFTDHFLYISESNNLNLYQGDPGSQGHWKFDVKSGDPPKPEGKSCCIS